MFHLLLVRVLALVVALVLTLNAFVLLIFGPVCPCSCFSDSTPRPQWACNIAQRFFTRYGQPHYAEEKMTDFAEAFSKQLAPKLLEQVLGVKYAAI